jgi:hypothetical protein
MPIFEMTSGAILPLEATSFSAENVQERQDLQRLLREHIDVIDPDMMVVAEEFCDWDDSRRRIDLLGLDRSGDLVVVELKRTEDGGHMDLQALRYAAMVSTMTFEQAIAAHQAYLEALGSTHDARRAILEFLGKDEPEEDSFAQSVRIVLASAEFSRELTTAVMWLNGRDIDIRCVRLRPYKMDNRLLIDVQQVLPLPEAEEYQVRVREKEKQERTARQFGRNWDRASFMEELAAGHSAEVVAVVERLLAWVEPRVHHVWWSQRTKTGGFMPVIQDETGARWYTFFSVRTTGVVENCFEYLVSKSPFAVEELRHDWREKLNRIPGVDIGSERISGRPTIPLRLLTDETAFSAFRDVYDWVMTTLDNHLASSQKA